MPPLWRMPIGLCEFNAPKMRRWGEKFDADTLALVGIAILADVHYARLLIFMCKLIGEDH